LNATHENASQGIKAKKVQRKKKMTNVIAKTQQQTTGGVSSDKSMLAMNSCETEIILK